MIRGYEFQTNQRANQQKEEEDPPKISGFPEKEDADKGSSKGPDPRPDGIGGSNRDLPDGQGQQSEAGNRANGKANGGDHPGKTGTEFEAGGKTDFKKTRQQKNKPRIHTHEKLPRHKPRATSSFGPHQNEIGIRERVGGQGGEGNHKLTFVATGRLNVSRGRLAGRQKVLPLPYLVR